MANIRMDTEGLEQCITSMRKCIEELESTAQSIDNTVMNNLGESWEGNSHNKCVSTYSDEYRTLLTKTVPDAVSSMKEFMETSMKNMVEADGGTWPG